MKCTECHTQGNCALRDPGEGLGAGHTKGASQLLEASLKLVCSPDKCNSHRAGAQSSWVQRRAAKLISRNLSQNSPPLSLSLSLSDFQFLFLTLTYMHTYIYICTYSYIHTYIHTYIHPMAPYGLTMCRSRNSVEAHVYFMYMDPSGMHLEPFSSVLSAKASANIGCSAPSKPDQRRSQLCVLLQHYERPQEAAH